jgi:hypothetical protein
MNPVENPQKGNQTQPSSAKDFARPCIEHYLHTLDSTSDGESHLGQRPTWQSTSPDEWTISTVGSHGQRISIEMTLREYTLQLMTFHMRKPDESETEVYRLLLRRNLEQPTVKFGLNEDGDIFLRADVPANGITEDVLDRVVGLFYSCADDSFMPVMRLGFAGGLSQAAGGSPGRT